MAAPWQGGSPLATDRALAALGDGPVVHAVVEREQPLATVVDPRTGAERALDWRVEAWYDEERARFRVRMAIGGRAGFDELRTASSPGAPGGAAQLQVDPAIEAFAGGYRAALERGDARVAGETTVDGRKAVVLRIGAPEGRYEEIAVDADTYRPLRLRFGSERSGEGEWWRVVAMETVARDEAQFDAHPIRSRVGQTGRGTNVDERHAATALRAHRAVWPGPSVGALGLSGIMFDSWTSRWSDGTETHGESLRFDYGTREHHDATEPWLSLTETLDRREVPQLDLFGLAPTVPEELLLVRADGPSGRTGWSASVVLDGVYVRLESSDRELVEAAVKGLRPMP